MKAMRDASGMKAATGTGHWESGVHVLSRAAKPASLCAMQMHIHVYIYCTSHPAGWPLWRGAGQPCRGPHVFAPLVCPLGCPLSSAACAWLRGCMCRPGFDFFLSLLFALPWCFLLLLLHVRPRPRAFTSKPLVAGNGLLLPPT